MIKMKIGPQYMNYHEFNDPAKKSKMSCQFIDMVLAVSYKQIKGGAFFEGLTYLSSQAIESIVALSINFNKVAIEILSKTNNFHPLTTWATVPSHLDGITNYSNSTEEEKQIVEEIKCKLPAGEVCCKHEMNERCSRRSDKLKTSVNMIPC